MAHDMNSDFTQQQSGEDQRQSQQLSLQKSQPPTNVPGYQLDRFLGSGAYGEVWVGTDRNTGRHVAIKFYLHSGGLDWSLLSHEVEKLVFLSADRYVVQLLDVGWNAEPPYYVMEYVENGSLEDYLKEHGQLPVSEAMEIFHEMVIGLLHAHNKGVLHCDLKPANILLDQDRKPRLADFGQSRLSHDQTPALGTLFYMAPEQAHLEAVPDVRWDIYALGAILYRMLTGEPPHRNPQVIQQLDTVGGLDKRLAKYRQMINRQTTPLKIPKQAGLDRSLTEILCRCLEANPEKRFHNVQEVLDAVETRKRNRARRPLTILGVLGPMFLLIMMTVFGSYWYGRTIQEARTAVRDRVHESNAWVAKHVARSIEEEIARYFEVIESEAVRPEFLSHFGNTEKLSSLANLYNTANDDPAVADQRSLFIEDVQRHQLRDYLQKRLTARLDNLKQNPNSPKFASLFALDRHGTILAVAYDQPVTTRSVGKNYGFRTYFHGGNKDKSRDLRTPEIKPINQTHLSAVFQSTTTKTWKVAVSTPIYREEQGKQDFVGVIALTVNLGDFAYLRNQNRQNHFAVLIDGRPGSLQGTILQHPAFDERLKQSGTDDQKTFQLSGKQLEQLQSQTRQLYRDPISQSSQGQEYEGDWIAAIEPVRLPDEPQFPDSVQVTPRKLMVVVQESESIATSPVTRLASQLLAEGILALVVLSLATGGRWFFVIRSTGEPTATSEDQPVTPEKPMKGHDLTTMAASPNSPPGKESVD